MSKLKSLVMSGLRLCGREVLSCRAYADLQHRSEELFRQLPRLREYEFLRGLPRDAGKEAFDLLPESKAQFRQDLFVLSELGFRRGGFFVEFGAANGIEASNTWLLEKKFDWTGIVSEPARGWHADLSRNRECRIDGRCVWSRSGETVRFSEIPTAPQLSTIESFVGRDLHTQSRNKQVVYEVPTVSLLDLLVDHDAPREIDYLSIDTEGSEFDILAAFDFNAYRIRIITVEHNFTSAREKLRRLLEGHGFRRKLQTVSHVDDWYVLGP